MPYTFEGNLRGFHCQDCFIALSQVKIKLYEADSTPNVAALAAASEKETFHQRSEEELGNLSKRLLAEGETDESGDFVLELSEQQYNGGAFDIDFECGTVPLQLPIPPKPRGPFQFNITTLQPTWRESADERGTTTAAYQYTIPAKWLCRIYALFDTWVICGKVTDCTSKTPLEGLKVMAFDVDWRQDDELGSDFTNSNGKFRIVYDGDRFRKTMLSWLNVEWPAGPDYYFRIESSSGEVFLKEERSMGHQRGRENASNCFCIDFCVDGTIVTDKALFTHVGNLSLSAIGSTGTTLKQEELGVDKKEYGFFGAIKMRGYAPEKFSPTGTSPLFYRFRYMDDSGEWKEITKDHVYKPAYEQ